MKTVVFECGQCGKIIVSTMTDEEAKGIDIENDRLECPDCVWTNFFAMGEAERRKRRCSTRRYGLG